MVPELSTCFIDSSCACTCECVCLCVRAWQECGDVCHNTVVKILYIVTAVNNSVYCFESRWFMITRAAHAYSLLCRWMSDTNKCTCNKAVREFSGCFSVADAGPPAHSLSHSASCTVCLVIPLHSCYEYELRLCCPAFKDDCMANRGLTF